MKSLKVHFNKKTDFILSKIYLKKWLPMWLLTVKVTTGKGRPKFL